ncbi:Alpha/beta hydrolase fold-1 [Alternaria rosae]|uniref:Alpha/beta hydrolase fold-1 n=1 Tax=Alternaria rosae TaxID=1187941 RepID=UPI001E8EB914|nr:Alpha/beta hydrolase fold-1 [Alternaria rosae]KAH6868194.1 Alpha/beta hydrolase fold-1 [Alternaria rosae]
MTKPQLILIPGAWHTPSAFLPLNTKLNALGYTTRARQLASVGSTDHPTTDLSADIAIVRSMIDTAIGASGNDVVVIAHSWGGIVASSALVGFGKTEREALGKKGGVVRCGYIAASMLPEGVSLMDSMNHTFPPWCKISGPHVLPLDPYIFYSDLPLDEQAYWFSQIQPHSLASAYAKTTGAAWKNIPSSYLVCEEDKSMPVIAQDKMIEVVRAEGAEVQVTRLACGHSPFLSRVQETVQWVRRVAGEDF